MKEEESKKASLKKGLDLRLLSMACILIVMGLFFRWQVGELYFSGEGIAKLSRGMATWTILAAGMTLIIVAGHIDLSVGSLLALVAGCCAYMIDPETGLGWSTSVAVPLALLLGLAVGLWQGFLIAYFRIPAFIITLAGLFVFRGFVQKVSARDPRLPDASWVNVLGFSYVPPAAGMALALVVCVALTSLVIYCALRKKRLGMGAVNWPLLMTKIVIPCVLILAFVHKVNDYKGIPAQTLVMLGAMVLLGFIARQTLFGRHVFAIGGNPDAARLSGISTEKTTIIVFGIMGLLAGVAGVVWMAQNQGATQKAGEWYELYAIAACVIGGTSLMGGRGSVLGSLLGALVMAMVIQGMDYTGLENWLQLVVRGSVLALAVGVDVASRDPAPWMRRVKEAIFRKAR